MSSTLELWDICANRHGGNKESVAANAKSSAVRRKQRAAVLSVIRACGSVGISCKELAEKWGVGMNVISGRFTELKADNLIRKVGVRRGSGVYSMETP